MSQFTTCIQFRVHKLRRFQIKCYEIYDISNVKSNLGVVFQINADNVTGFFFLKETAMRAHIWHPEADQTIFVALLMMFVSLIETHRPHHPDLFH